VNDDAVDHTIKFSQQTDAKGVEIVRDFLRVADGRNL